MNRSICPICNQFYEDLAPTHHMCDDCLALKIKAVEYVKAHTFASIAEITLTTGIPIKHLKKLLEHGYLENSRN